MKKLFSLFFVLIILNSCAITKLGQMIPGKMTSVVGDKQIDFGIQLVLAAAGGGNLQAHDKEEGVNYVGSYSYSPIKDYEGYNTRGNLYGGGNVYTIHLVIYPSLGIPSGEGVAKENGVIKYTIIFPVYD